MVTPVPQRITNRLKTQRSDRWQNLPDRRRVQGFDQLTPFLQGEVLHLFQHSLKHFRRLHR
jgi:hypothetical protein